MTKNKQAIELIEKIIFKKLNNIDDSFKMNYDKVMKLISNKFFTLSFNPFFTLFILISIVLTYSYDNYNFKILISCLYISFYIINVRHFFKLVSVRYKMSKLIFKINSLPIEGMDLNEIIESRLFSIKPGCIVTYGDLIEIKKKILLASIKK